MKMDTTEVAWYEDGNFLEWYVGEGLPKDRRYKHCGLEQAIEFAWKQKMVLVIQPAYQNECIFADFTIGDENEII